MLVATASPHREAALAACHFLIDWLKTDAPFWKSEETPAGERWVDAARRGRRREIALEPRRLAGRGGGRLAAALWGVDRRWA